MVGWTGLVSQYPLRRTFVAQRSGLTRGDRRRNDRVEGVRRVVTADRAILAIDLGEDKQVAVLLDHDGRVLGRRTVLVKVFALGAVLAWAVGQAGRCGFDPLGVRLSHASDPDGFE